MKGNRGRAVSAICVFVVLSGFGSLTLFRSGTTTVQATPPPPPTSNLPAAGRFRVGAKLGEERACFSGLPMLQVFTSAGDTDYASVVACLKSSAVEAELESFTPILVDEDIDSDCERKIRERDGLGVVVRSLNGKFLGGLPHGFACDDLLELLESIQRHQIMRPKKSPIYAHMLDSPRSAVDWMVGKGQTDKAARCVEFLEEFEGAGSSAAQTARARLGH